MKPPMENHGWDGLRQAGVPVILYDLAGSEREVPAVRSKKRTKLKGGLMLPARQIGRTAQEPADPATFLWNQKGSGQ